MVGVKKGPSRRRVPVDSSDWNTKVPMITRPAEKLDPLPPGCFYRDDVLKRMDIRVANMAYYHGHCQKLLDDITQVRWTTFCFKIKYFLVAKAIQAFTAISNSVNESVSESHIFCHTPSVTAYHVHGWL